MCVQAVLVGAALLVLAPLASADDATRLHMMRVRLSTDASIAAGCTQVGMVSDDSARDLRRKIVAAGGNTAVVSFGIVDLSMMYAEVYHCALPAAATPTAGGPSHQVPPPPPGPPPPPPPMVPPPPPPPPPTPSR